MSMRPTSMSALFESQLLQCPNDRSDSNCGLSQLVKAHLDIEKDKNESGSSSPMPNMFRADLA